MTFDEWWIEYRGFDDPYGKDGMRDCWNAAMISCSRAMREKCARHIEGMDDTRGYGDAIREVTDVTIEDLE